MTQTIIEIPQINDSFSRIVIKDKEYSLRFTYNDTFDCWTFGVYNPDRTPIVQGLKIVPNHPINIFAKRPDMPNVMFGCESKLGRIGRYDFRDGNAEFYYLEF